MPGTYKEIIWQGENVTLPYTLLDGGDPIDLTGWTISWRVWRKGNDNILTKSVTLVTPASGEVSVTLSATDTALAAGEYPFEMRRTDSGSVKPLIVGTLTVRDSPFVSV